MFKRYPEIPLIQAGGVQPYAPAGGREPGPALQAMTGGRTLFGLNPMDAQRQSVAMARRRPRPSTLLDSLAR